MIYRIIAVMIALSLAFMPCDQVSADPDIELDYYIGNDSSQQGIFGTNWASQSYAHSGDMMVLTKVAIKAYRLGTPGTVTYRIRAASGGVPTGADLSSGTVDGNTFTTVSTGEWYTVTLSTPLVITNGQPLSIVVNLSGGDASNYIRWKYSNLNDFPSGFRCTSSNSGSTWSNVPLQDHAFKTWGEYPELPTGVTAFYAMRNSDYTITSNWTRSDYGENVVLCISYTGDYPENYDDTVLYSGTALTYVTDPLPFYVPVSLRIWEHNASGYSGYSEYYIGGDPLDITLDINVGLIGIILGLAFIILAGIFRSPLLWVAAFVCFIGIYFEPDIFDTYYQVGAGIVMVFCLIMCTFHYRLKRNGG